MKPTPGPWRVSDFEIHAGSKHRVVMGADDFSICHVGERDGDENDANARLMAAAPELLTTLRRVLTAGNKPDLSVKENRDALDAAISDGWSAIKKAEAKQ